MNMGKQKPWINGLIDGISASNLIRISKIEHKNRIAFIILDSTLEMAFKKFIENEKKIINVKDSTWRNRETINKIVKKHTDFDKEVWDDVEYFYGIRIGLYHEDSEKTVTDTTIDNFQEVVEFFINNLFDVHCSQLVPVTYSLIPNQQNNSGETIEEQSNGISINKISEKINVMIVTVAESKSRDYDAILEYLQKRGFRGKISKSMLSVYMNNTFKHMFYFDEYWKLTQDEGMKRYEKLKKVYAGEKSEENGKRGK